MTSSTRAATWVAWIIEAECKPEDQQAILELAEEMSDYFHSHESETTHFELSLSPDHSLIHVHERYASSEAGIAHIQAFGAHFMSRFSALLEPKRVVVYGFPSEELLSILAGFSPLILTSIAGFNR